MSERAVDLRPPQRLLRRLRPRQRVVVDDEPPGCGEDALAPDRFPAHAWPVGRELGRSVVAPEHQDRDGRLHALGAEPRDQRQRRSGAVSRAGEGYA